MFCNETPEVLKLIVETHHESFDGAGYPYGLVGDGIHIFARILRVTDAFASATTSAFRRDARSPLRVMWEMVKGEYHPLFDPALLKIFASVIQPFAIGTKVRLNTGKFGVVVRHGGLLPFLPEIVIAFDENGARLRADGLSPPMRLHDDCGLRIVECEGEDVTDLYRVDAGT